MTARPITIPATATVDDATRLMEHLSMRHLPVVDVGGRLIGMISDRDVRGPRSRSGRHRPTTPPPTMPILDVMAVDVFTASADDELTVIARVMADRGVGAVPIVDGDGVPVGIISYVDVLRRLVDDEGTAEEALELMDRAEFVAHPAPK